MNAIVRVSRVTIGRPGATKLRQRRGNSDSVPLPFFMTIPVSFERGEIPEGFPDGRFDLIVASEVLYYLDDPALEAAVEAIAAALEPGGSLLAVHWRPHTRTYPQRGDDVHARLAALGWPAGASERTPSYALDRLDRPA